MTSRDRSASRQRQTDRRSPAEEQLEALARYADLPKTAAALAAYEAAARNFNVESIHSEEDLRLALCELSDLGKAVTSSFADEIGMSFNSLAHIHRPPDWLRIITKAWTRRKGGG